MREATPSGCSTSFPTSKRFATAQDSSRSSGSTDCRPAEPSVRPAPSSRRPGLENAREVPAFPRAAMDPPRGPGPRTSAAVESGGRSSLPRGPAGKRPTGLTPPVPAHPGTGLSFRSGAVPAARSGKPRGPPGPFYQGRFPKSVADDRARRPWRTAIVGSGSALSRELRRSRSRRINAPNLHPASKEGSGIRERSGDRISAEDLAGVRGWAVPQRSRGLSESVRAAVPRGRHRGTRGL